MLAHPAARVETPRLVLRPWREADAPLLREAIDAALPELQRWMPWARAEPVPLPALAERIRGFAASWEEGRDFTYGILAADESRALGGTGIHPRDGADPTRLEIGYWIRTDATGQGLATEAARAMLAEAARLPGVACVEIRCDPLNLASAAVARRAGAVHARTIPAHQVTVDGEPRDTMVWEWRP